MRPLQATRKNLLWGALVGAALLPSSLLAQDVKTDYDHSAEFTRYRTFSIGKIQSSDPLFQQRIQTAVTRDLTAKGLQAVPSGGDVTVTAIGNVKSQQEYNTFYDNLGGGGFGWRGWGGWGGGWGNNVGQSSTTVTQIPVGTLVVDLYDHGTHQLVWRGRAQDELSNKPEKNTKKLEKAVDKMFDKFPPKGAQ
jgi:hypothetical protein